MNEFVFNAQNEHDTDRLGAALAELLPDGTTVALLGTLGAGKTRLVRAIAAAVGARAEEIVSPTFVLCQEYHGQRSLFHLDAYRIRDDDEFLELGAEELFESGALTLIEWADRVENCLPPERVQISIETTGETARRFCITAAGERFRPFIAELQNRLGAA